ncbi:MAG: hypothetical protein IPI49_30965 [Myxococcales bacterium]|nr:hypothetical protein [Myxococcales bacterium]
MNQFSEAVEELCGSGVLDLLVFNGPIDRNGFDLVLDQTKPPVANEVMMVLTTLGGDADAAYRIATLLCRRYRTFHLLVPSYCKSAGTLLALGASEIIMADTGELGPLDVQIRKRDELLMRESGLEMVQGLQQLTSESVDAFGKTFIEVASGTGLSTRLCADIAAKVIGSLYGNIFQQIDPIRLGSVIRANAIAMHYGKLLGSKNLKPEALGRLVLDYPSHDFVIDRSQAEQLFNAVREPNPAEAKLVQAIEPLVKIPSTNKHIVKKLNTERRSHGAPKPAAKARSKRNVKGSGKSPEKATPPDSPKSSSSTTPTPSPGHGDPGASAGMSEAVSGRNGRTDRGLRTSARRRQPQSKN